MPRQNRVTPYGELIAVADRGMFWGNRGVLVDGQGRLARYSRGRAWAICVLEFKGRRRQQWSPGRLTELFFLDEATGLAAGHRPCGECRYRDYRAFKHAWAAAHGGGLPGVQDIDARLHADRLVRPGIRRTYTAPLLGLPDGAVIDLGGAPFPVYGGRVLAWTPGGYLDQRVEVPSGPVTVITPRATVAVLAAGYRPVVHPSAGLTTRLPPLPDSSPAFPRKRRPGSCAEPAWDVQAERLAGRPRRRPASRVRLGRLAPGQSSHCGRLGLDRRRRWSIDVAMTTTMDHRRAP